MCRFCNFRLTYLFNNVVVVPPLHHTAETLNALLEVGRGKNGQVGQIVAIQLDESRHYLRSSQQIGERATAHLDVVGVLLVRRHGLEDGIDSRLRRNSSGSYLHFLAL